MNINTETFFNAYKCLTDANSLFDYGLWDFSGLCDEGLKLIDKFDKKNDNEFNFVKNECIELSTNMYNTIRLLVENDEESAYYFNHLTYEGEFANYLFEKYDGEILCAGVYGDPNRRGINVYTREDGLQIKETYCPINLKPSDKFVEELEAFFEFEGDKVIDGVKISDMKYWVREDGAQMIGDYVCVATTVIPRQAYGVDDNMSDLKSHWEGGNYNYGDIVETSLGQGIVMGRCGEAYNYMKTGGVQNFDIYTLWDSPGYSSKVRADDYVPTNYANDPKLEYDGQAVIKASQTYEKNGILEEWSSYFPNIY